MSITLQATQVTINDDGTYNVYVRVYDTVAQKTLIQKSVTVNGKEELKDKIRPHWFKLKAHCERQQSLLCVASQAMAELEAEE